MFGSTQGHVLPEGFTVVERCDCCNTFADDLAAAKAVGRSAKWFRIGDDVDEEERDREGAVLFAICRLKPELADLVDLKQTSACCQLPLRHHRMGSRLSIFSCSKCGQRYVPVTKQERTYADIAKASVVNYESHIQWLADEANPTLKSLIDRDGAQFDEDASRTHLLTAMREILPYDTWLEAEKRRQPYVVIRTGDGERRVINRATGQNDVCVFSRCNDSELLDLLPAVVAMLLDRYHKNVPNWASLDSPMAREQYVNRFDRCDLAVAKRSQDDDEDEDEEEEEDEG